VNKKRLIALAAGVAITAAACGGAAGVDDLSADESADTIEATSGDSSDSDDGADTPPVAPGDLFSPTATDRPFDLTGGALSSDEGVSIVTDDPVFSDQAGQAVAPWTTD